MDAAEAHELHCQDLADDPGLRCINGTTIYGGWLFGCADRALARVGGCAPAEAFWAALDEEEQED